MGARRARRCWTDSAGASWIAGALRSLLGLSLRATSGLRFTEARRFDGRTLRTPMRKSSR
eukprot:3632933-Alexandrium_andersonii.AAC.1